MKLSTETKAGIMVACSFLGLTGVFVGKKLLDPDGKVEALVSETKTEGDPSRDTSKGDANGVGKSESKADAKGPLTPKEKSGEIVQTKSQVELPGGIPPLPGTAIPTSIPAPVTAKETLPGGIPPLPGTDIPPPNPMGGAVTKSDGIPALPPLLAEKSKNEFPVSPPPPPPPATVGGLPGGIPPLPGETDPQSNPAKTAVVNGAKEKPGTTAGIPKNDKPDLKLTNPATDLSKNAPPLPPPAGPGVIPGSATGAIIGGAAGAASAANPGVGTGILGAAPTPPPGIPAFETPKDPIRPGNPVANAPGSSEFSPSGTTSVGLPERKPSQGNLTNSSSSGAGIGGSTLPTSGLGGSSLGSPGLGGRIISAAIIPPVAVTTFSPNTGPIKRTEFVPIEEPAAAPPTNNGIPSGAPGPMATPPPPAPTGLPNLPPGGLSGNSGANNSPGFGNPPAFAASPPPAANRPLSGISGEDVKPALQPAGLQFTPLNSPPAKSNTPIPASKVSSWTEKVYNSAYGDTWETIAQTQYQRKELGRMLQSYNEIHPRLAALPKTGALPPNTEVYLPPAEELIRQGASAIPTPAPLPGLGSAPAPAPSGNLPPPGPLPPGLGGRP